MVDKPQHHQGTQHRPLRHARRRRPHGLRPRLRPRRERGPQLRRILHAAVGGITSAGRSHYDIRR
jgi:hypothetical protein